LSVGDDLAFPGNDEEPTSRLPAFEVVQENKQILITPNDNSRFPIHDLRIFGGQGRDRTADAGLFRAALYQLSYLAAWAGKTA
jgi:hypothetical protein